MNTSALLTANTNNENSDVQFLSLPILAPPPSGQQQQSLALQYAAGWFVSLDAAVCMFIVPLCVLNFLLVFRTSILHRNLKLVLLCESSAIMMRACFRLSWIIENLVKHNLLMFRPLIPFVSFCTVTGFRNFTGHMMIVERILATVFVKSYENYNRPHFSIACIFLALLYALMTISACVKNGEVMNMVVEGNKDPLNAAYSGVIQNVLLFILSCIELLVFYIMLAYNTRMYKSLPAAQAAGNKQRPEKQSLSERYQLAENIRTGRQLFPVLCIHMMNMANTLIVFLITYIQPFQNMFIYDTLVTCIQLLISSCLNFAIEAIIIKFHPTLNRQAVDWFRAATSAFHRHRAQVVDDDDFGKPAATHRASVQPQIITISGRPMIATPEANTEEHFEMLRTMWNWDATTNTDDAVRQRKGERSAQRQFA